MERTTGKSAQKWESNGRQRTLQRGLELKYFEMFLEWLYPKNTRNLERFLYFYYGTFGNLEILL